MINWEEIGADDFIAREGEYTLRVEKMDDEWWWWEVAYEGETVNSVYLSAADRPTNKAEAMGICESAYTYSLKHIGI